MEKEKFTLDFEKPLHVLQEQLEGLRNLSGENEVSFEKEILAIETKIEDTRRKIYSNLTPWQRVQLARHPNRPYSLDYIPRLFEHFEELHGDRLYRDDQAILGGVAQLDGRPVVVIAQQKGRNTRENILRNFGCPDPEGYRKALRLMQMAGRFGLPVITLVDTPGAYPGIGSEERHVAEAIAVNLREMSQLPVPIVTYVIGEGGSGGALGIAVSDRVNILSNAYYSVISPEGCAAILWKNRAHAADAANALQITADKLLELGIVDNIINEPLGGAHQDYDQTAADMRQSILAELASLDKLSVEALLEERYAKFRRMGVYSEN